MLSLMTPADAAFARMRSRTGAWLLCGAEPVPCDLTEGSAALTAPDGVCGMAMPFARPQARKAAGSLSYGDQAAGQVEVARQQRTSNVQNTHTIRIAARLSLTKGGAHSGPHPARDPV